MKCSNLFIAGAACHFLGLLPIETVSGRELYTSEDEVDIHLLQCRLDQGCDVNARDDDGVTLLHLACANPNGKGVEIVKLLLGAGADVNAQTDSEHLTPLHVACATSDGDAIEVVRLLVEAGADLNCESKNFEGGCAPIHLAARCGNTTVVEYLISKGADFTMKGTACYTPLHEACRGCHLKTATLLLSKCPAGYRGFLGDCRYTPLHVLIEFSGDKNPDDVESMVDFLLASGADINEREYWNGETPIFFAVQYGSPRLVKYLISRGADPRALKNNGDSLMEVAKRWHNEEMISLILALLLQ